jgi:hypothetical protein
MERRKLINDAFFEKLKKERPQREADISAVWTSWCANGQAVPAPNGPLPWPAVRARWERAVLAAICMSILIYIYARYRGYDIISVLLPVTEPSKASPPVTQFTEQVQDAIDDEFKRARELRLRRSDTKWLITFKSIDSIRKQAAIEFEFIYKMKNNDKSEQPYRWPLEFDVTEEFSKAHPTVHGKLEVLDDQGVLVRKVNELTFGPLTEGNGRFELKKAVEEFHIPPGKSYEFRFGVSEPIEVRFPYSDYWHTRWPSIGMEATINYGRFPLATDYKLLRANPDGVDNSTFEDGPNRFHYKVNGAFLPWQGFWLSIRNREDKKR